MSDIALILWESSLKGVVREAKFTQLYFRHCNWTMTITIILDLEGWLLVANPIKSSDISLQLLTLHRPGM